MVPVLLLYQLIALQHLLQAVLQVLLQVAHALKAMLLQASAPLPAQLKQPLQLAPPIFALIFHKPIVPQMQQIALGVLPALKLQLLIAQK